MRTVGAVVRGIRTPIVREGDDLVTLVRDSVMAASETEHITFHDRDIVAVTESVVARAAGNYATVQNIADDVKAKFGCDHIGVIFPILSRNRFAIVLRGIATGMKKITLMLSYPSDEVGNHLFDEELLEDSGINPYSDVLTEEEYRKAFGYARPWSAPASRWKRRFSPAARASAHAATAWNRLPACRAWTPRPALCSAERDCANRRGKCFKSVKFARFDG